ncbi:helix-turn-helix domain-containing protein [Streptomyces avidinii]
MIGNHLAQHRELSLTAIGLAAHIQSLPGGARIGIKDLTRRFAEGEVRIASALRELEAHGYLSRTKEHLPGGRIITRTVSHNRPGALSEPDSAPQGEPAPAAARDPESANACVRVAADVDVDVDGDPGPEPGPEPEPEPDREPGPAEAPAAAAVPEPEKSIPSRREEAKRILGRLRRLDQRLLLGERDVERLACGVEAWLERGASPDAVTALLTANLPAHVRNPAGLVAHRLAHQLPPVLGPVYREQAFVPPDPFQTCTECDRAFRSPTHGKCRGCAEEDDAADGFLSARHN